MTVEFTRWPDALAARYREKGYWQDLLIVPASSPESEWRETGVKLSTMLNVFGLH